MSVFWWISGLLLAVVWLDRARDARGMRMIPDLGEEQFDSNPPVPQQSGAPLRVAAIVPARNEEQHIESTIRSLLAQDVFVEVVAVDDRSTDHTGMIMDAIGRKNAVAGSSNPLRVLHVADLPAGWLGKTHAMWMATQQAAGADWLLFTDADVKFRSDAVRRAIAYAELTGTDHLVVFPDIPVETIGGRMMLTFFEILFVFGHRPWKVSDPSSRDSIGFGPFNLIRRSAYDSVGTWWPLRMAVVEDMKLGELVKQKGFRSRCAFGVDLLTHAWARTGRDVIRNLEKNFFAVMRYRPSLAIAGCIALLFFNLFPFVGATLATGWARVPFVVALAGLGGLYKGLTKRARISWLYFFGHPVATVAFVYILLRSMAHALLNGGVIWRGTKYTLEELRREHV